WSLLPENFYVLDEHQQRVAPTFVINQFLIIKNEANHKEIKLGRFDGHSVVALQHENQTVFGIKARNRTQQFLMEALITEEGEERLVIIEGPAGTAKTLFALAVGIEAKQSGVFKKFYVTRSNVEADESFGYLPGSMDVKFDGFLNPIYDNLEVLVDVDKDARKKDGKEVTDKNLLLDQLQIEAKPLNYMRGRSLRKSLIFVDESQNLTRAQVKMIVTRAGEGSVVVLCGDTEQIDGRLNKFNNGLTHALRCMKGEKLCYILRLSTADAERSELSKVAATKL
ncbi:MAG TPA: PhoH family protein, partial [bacterium]|nr:PhoH family protein [bacterium]